MSADTRELFFASADQVLADDQARDLSPAIELVMVSDVWMLEAHANGMDLSGADRIFTRADGREVWAFEPGELPT